MRRSIQSLWDDYRSGRNRRPLEDLIRAWRAIEALPPSDPRSFFALGGYHGEPFTYRPQVDALSAVDRYVYWGGYCNHGNVLFPTWHRVYVLKLELALQSVVPGVAMPFWDETSPESLANGIPEILTNETFLLDGQEIPNPLRSFMLTAALSDDATGDDRAYTKPKGYQTVRYPLSGLVGTAAARQATEAHNRRYPDPTTNTALLNQNIVQWLAGPKPEKVDGKTPPSARFGVHDEFVNCLAAPNYTVFSNTTSAAAWNSDHSGRVTALESPHNDIHLAVGGFDVPAQGFQAGIIADANGDMGENNTAGMDPIFFFHHCNIDRVFWLWQQRHGATQQLDVIDGYPGTSSNDEQGPTPGIAPGTRLTMSSPLAPFVKDDFGTPFTSNDCIDIAKLGYTYEAGSLSTPDVAPLLTTKLADQKLTVRGIDRALFQGSFVLRVFATVTAEGGNEVEVALGHYSVLSRRNVIGCANCLTHLEVVAHLPLTPEAVEAKRYRLQIQHRGPVPAAEPTAREALLATADGAELRDRAALPEGLDYSFAVTD